MPRYRSLETFPILATKRLLLREITPDDAGIIYEIFSDSAVTRYYDVGTFTHKEQAERLIRWCANRLKYKDGIRWGIVHSQTDRLIGTCGFHNWRKSHQRVEMGYELGSQYWGHGFAFEAVNEILSFGFNHLRFNRIEAWAMLPNKASMHLLRKTGFTQEGLLRDYGFWHGRFQDVIMFSILKREWDDRAA